RLQKLHLLFEEIGMYRLKERMIVRGHFVISQNLEALRKMRARTAFVAVETLHKAICDAVHVECDGDFGDRVQHQMSLAEELRSWNSSDRLRFPFRNNIGMMHVPEFE